MKIHISTDTVSVTAEMNDTPTGKAIADALPIEGQVNRWGEEIYFMTDISAALEPDARDVLQPGELAFWPPGKAFCIFFGETPVSQAGECRAASDINPFGKVTDNIQALWDIQDGETIRIEKA